MEDSFNLFYKEIQVSKTRYFPVELCDRDLENFATAYRLLEHIINLAWKVGCSERDKWDHCRWSAAHSDRQAQSAARFCCMGLLATADTCWLEVARFYCLGVLFPGHVWDRAADWSIIRGNTHTCCQWSDECLLQVLISQLHTRVLLLYDLVVPCNFVVSLPIQQLMPEALCSTGCCLPVCVYMHACTPG